MIYETVNKSFIPQGEISYINHNSTRLKIKLLGVGNFPYVRLPLARHISILFGGLR